MKSRHLLATTAVLLFATALSLLAQTVSLQTSGNRTAETSTTREPIAATQEIVAETTLQLITADGHSAGDVWLELVADNAASSPTHITLRIPLSSTGDAYGESRSCHVAPDGSFDLLFTAGLDEQNFVTFAPATQAASIHLLLNKYLCRALAAPFLCNSHPIALNQDWSQWRLGRSNRVTLSSSAPATLTLSPLRVTTTGHAFDSASCKVIAPSDGLCCVSGKTTQWHCGGTPTGDGWHQVSGECFHRETGSACTDGQPLNLAH